MRGEIERQEASGRERLAGERGLRRARDCGFSSGTEARDRMEVQVVPTGGEAGLQVPWFAQHPVYTEEEVEMYSLAREDVFFHRRRSPEIFFKEAAVEAALPSDPRLWSRAEVCLWVSTMCRTHRLPPPNTERFLMNGKAVCLMSVNMFTSRVPLGGKLLYRDFQIRLAKALHCKRG